MKKKREIVIEYSEQELEIIRELEVAAKTYHPIYSWTPFQLEMLKQYYGKVPLQKLEFLLHHASSSIKDKAGELGLCMRGRGSDLNPQVEVVKKATCSGESPK